VNRPPFDRSRCQAGEQGSFQQFRRARWTFRISALHDHLQIFPGRPALACFPEQEEHLLAHRLTIGCAIHAFDRIARVGGQLDYSGTIDRPQLK